MYPSNRLRQLCLFLNTLFYDLIIQSITELSDFRLLKKKVVSTHNTKLVHAHEKKDIKGKGTALLLLFFTVRPKNMDQTKI